MGNVEKASLAKDIFEIYNGKISKFNGSALQENLRNYFHKKKPEPITIQKSKLSERAQKLYGTGSSAWFELQEEHFPENHFRIKRYNENCEVDFDGIYKASEEFDMHIPYTFTYDSHCAYCHILQKEKKIKFERVANYETYISSLQKVHLA